MENKLKDGLYQYDCIGDTDMKDAVELKKNYFGGYTFQFYVNPYSKRIGESKSSMTVNIDDNNYKAIAEKMDNNRIKFTIPDNCKKVSKYNRGRDDLKKLIINKMVELLTAEKLKVETENAEKLFNEKNDNFNNLGFETCNLDPKRPGYCATNNSTAAAAAGGRRKKSVRKSNRRVRKSRKQRKSTRRVRS